MIRLELGCKFSATLETWNLFSGRFINKVVIKHATCIASYRSILVRNKFTLCLAGHSINYKLLHRCKNEGWGVALNKNSTRDSIW